MLDLLTPKQARRIWGIPSKTLYRWIDMGILDLVQHQGKSYVRVVSEEMDQVLEIGSGQQSITVAQLRDLAEQEGQRICEVFFMKRVLITLPVAIAVGLICVELGSIGMQYQMLSGLTNGLQSAFAGFITFIMFMGHAMWSWRGKNKEAACWNTDVRDDPTYSAALKQSIRMDRMCRLPHVLTRRFQQAC